MESAPKDAPGDRGDEVARQRTKRQAALSARPVPGWPAMTLGELAETARSAAPAEGLAGVHRFLSEAGHSPDTIAAVLGCLSQEQPDAEESGAVVAFPAASLREQRLRRLADLEAMLLDE